MLAPIGITVYARLSHLRQAVSALQQNPLAAESDLFFFSDAPAPGHEEKVQAMRDYLATVDGFKSVTIIARQENSRLKNNRGGQRQLLEEYGKVIWLAEDIVTAPGFLTFMNGALDAYEDNPDVFSITGYVPPIEIPADYERDYFALQRFSAWGFATWWDQYSSIPQTLVAAEVERDLGDKSFLCKLTANGEDIPTMLEWEVDGRFDALDVKIMYEQIKRGSCTIYPRQSLVQNIGLDGTGLHCGKSDKFDHNKLWEKAGDFTFTDDISIDDRIRKAQWRFRRLSLRARLSRAVKSTKIGAALNSLREKP